MIQPQPQPSAGASYAHKLIAADSTIDWSQSAAAIERQIRALTDRAPAVSWLGDDRVRLLHARVMHADGNGPGAAPSELARPAPGTLLAADPSGIRVQCGQDILSIDQLGLSRGKGTAMSVKQALNGYRDLLAPGAVFRSRAGSPAKADDA